MIKTIAARKPFQTQVPWVLFLSITLQSILALFFGNLYDMRINMATGYWVAAGHNPYVAQDLSAVFHNELFRNFYTIGYPPPWAMVLGIVFKSVYAVLPNFFLYNFAIKIPIIAATICLAYLTAHFLGTLGVEASISKKARNFLLLNPVVLLYSSAWGQIDSVVALFSLSAMILLNAEKVTGAAILLALAISIKPIALPLAPAAFIFLRSKTQWKMLWFFMVFCTGVFVFCVVPFMIFNWDPSVIFKNWNAHFIVAGCMSFMSISEIWNKTFQIAGLWRFLGILWAFALFGFTAYCSTMKITGCKELLKLSTVMILVFFLTRSWVSEPNILLLLPFVLILTSIGELDRISFALLWALPLVFSFFNGSLVALLFPSMPEAMISLIRRIDTYRLARLLARSAVIIPWYLAGWWTVIRYCKTMAGLNSMAAKKRIAGATGPWK